MFYFFFFLFHESFVHNNFFSIDLKIEITVTRTPRTRFSYVVTQQLLQNASIFHSDRNLLFIHPVISLENNRDPRSFANTSVANSQIVRVFQDGIHGASNNCPRIRNLRTTARSFSSPEWNESRFHILPATPIEIFFPTGYNVYRLPHTPWRPFLEAN